MHVFISEMSSPSSSFLPCPIRRARAQKREEKNSVISVSLLHFLIHFSTAWHYYSHSLVPAIPRHYLIKVISSCSSSPVFLLISTSTRKLGKAVKLHRLGSVVQLLERERLKQFVIWKLERNTQLYRIGFHYITLD